MKLKNLLLKTCLWSILIFSSLRLDAQYYNFENATIGGGGYVTGLVFHPSEQNLLYARTDVGGAYRWNADLNQWKQLMLSVPEYGSVDGFALTASNPNVIYMACGNSVIKNPKDFEVLKSTDRGESWIKLGFNNIAGIERAFEGNQRDVRYIGERIAVDPANENIVFVGTKENGLWKSLNGGTSWTKVNSIPNSTVFTVITHHPDAKDIGYVGVRNILFDPNTISGGKTQVIYVGNYEDGLYKSTDAGNTFTKISGSPKTIRRMDLSPNGSTLWATTGYPIGGAWGDGGKVYKYANESWIAQNVSPNAANDPMGALDVHPTDPNKIYLTAGKNGAEQKIYRTEDGGATWYEIHYHKNNRNHQGQGWWQSWLFATGPSSIAFNPYQEGQVWFASGEGVWKTDAAWTSAPLWKAEVNKIEELVGLVVVAPLSGAQVLMGSADTDGFRITDVNSPPQQRLGNLGETTDIAIVENNPNHMVRVGGHSWGKYGKGSYSTDNGITWIDFPGWPGGKPSGKVAVSANNLDKIVAIPLNSKPIYSTDRGASWQESTIDANTIVYQMWQHDRNLQADKVNGNIFYIYNRENGKFFRSENGGATFNHVNTLASRPWGDWVNVRTIPGVEKAVWASSYNGLHKSSNGGDSFTKIPNVEEVKAFSFGANPPGKSNPSLYLVGQINGQKGMFLSEDMGATFRIINRGEQKIGDGLNVTDIAASRQEFGKVFLSTGGWGLWYGSSDGLGSVNYNLTTNAQNGTVSPTNGVYSSSSTVTLTATPNPGYIFTGWSGDLSGNGNPVTITMNGNKNITANFKVPQLKASLKTDRTKGGAPLLVNFDATSSIDEDPNNSITSFAWNFGDGTSGTGNMVNHTYNALGTYKAILTVTNNKNEKDTTSVKILVDFIPTIQIVSPANNATFTVGTSVTLETAINDGGENDIDRVVFFDKNWNWKHTDRTSPYSYTFTIAEGANEFRAQIFDSKGNATNTSLFTIYGELVSLSKKESFTNHLAATGSWSNGSFVGDEGLTWKYNQHQTRTDMMTGKSARIKAGGWGRLETTIPDGIGSLQFDLMGDGSSPARSKIEVFINNTSYGVFAPSSSSTPNTIIIEDINVFGAVYLKFASVDYTVHMDNIEWTLPVVQYSLTGTSINGSVTFNPAGGVYEAGTQVTLTAMPDSGYYFHQWSGDVTGSANPLVVLMDTNKIVTAQFLEIANARESFDNHSGTGSWSNGSFTGDQGFVWNYNQNRKATGLMTGSSAVIKGGGWGKLKGTIPFGMSSLSFDLLGSGSSPANTQVEVFINSVSKGIFSATSQTVPNTIILNNLNEVGDVGLEFKAVNANVNLDNIAWAGNLEFVTLRGGVANSASRMDPESVSELQGVKFYPNPTRERMTIDFGTIENASMEIVDVTGKQVKERQFVRGLIELDLPRGIYFMRLNNGYELVTSKLIFE